MKTTRLILAGGFLGAGKTTLLWKAAQKLMEQGLRVGLITNDQAPELVDSALLELNDLKVAEVSGSCFCCNFNGFTHAIQQIREEVAADVIIAEPVGSCTDLSATIIQPLKQYWDREITLSPLSVLADPVRLSSILDGGNGGLHPDAAYIYRKQLEESDMIVINKADMLNEEKLEALKRRTAETYPSATLFAISAQADEGVDEWLQAVTTRNESGKRLVDVNYDIYANGEAVLGWLNGTVCLRSETSTDWDTFLRQFMNELSRQFDTNGYAVGHVKMIGENGEQFIAGNITGRGETLSFRGSAGTGDYLKLILNARVETSPEILNHIVRDALDSSADHKYKVEVLAWRYLQPGRPTPTHRFSRVVKL